jgi:INO80 complex subunit C
MKRKETDSDQKTGSLPNKKSFLVSPKIPEYSFKKPYTSKAINVPKSVEPQVNLNIPTYSSISVPCSLKPAKKYCDITGYEASYTEPQTGLRYCDADIYHFIRTYLTDKQIGNHKANQYLQIRGTSKI